MYLHNLLLSAFILLAQSLWSQEAPMFTYPKFIVKTDLLSWSALERPAFFAGLEYRPIPAVAIEADYGLKLNVYVWENSPESLGRFNYNYTKLRIAVNFHPAYHFQYIEPILGFQFFYHPESYTRFDSWYWRDGSQWSYDRSDIVVKSVGTNLHFGLQFRIIEKMILQFYTGAGIKHITATHETVNEQAFSPGWFDWGGSRDQVEGVGIRGHLYWSIKLGYVITGSTKNPLKQSDYERSRRAKDKI
ncbi:MAG: hypothetical protein SF052_11410 [Bacteroidia bacterium]|nr:hypothetical protein [Bacteroidia bacterium]